MDKGGTLVGMKKILTGLSAALVAIGLAACGAPVTGTVVEKTYKPDESGYAYTYGLNPATGKYGYAYLWQSDPECYGVHVRSDSGEMRSACITEGSWNALEVGDYIASEEK